MCCRLHELPPFQDVLYPSEDVEEQLSILSVYPTPESLAEVGGDEYEGTAPDSETNSAVRAAKGDGATATVVGDGAQNEPSLQDSLQERTDEVLKSITSSFAAVTDMFGPKNGHVSPSLSPSKQAIGNEAGMHRQAASGDIGGVVGGMGDTRGTSRGWDMFKPPIMAEMKRRLEGGGRSVSPARIHNKGVNAGVPGSNSANTTPTGGGFGMFGDSFRDFRRRSQEAVDEAVTKLKSALDGSDSDEPNVPKSGAATAESKSSAIRAAARSGRPYTATDEDDSFWRPFGDAPGASEEPVPLPPMPASPGVGMTGSPARRGQPKSQSPARGSAKKRLDAYYGGGSGGR